MNYFKAAAESGLLNALNNYGLGLRDGFLEQQFPQEAIKCFEQLYSQGHVNGSVN
jgi:TPR repeat protein